MTHNLQLAWNCPPRPFNRSTTGPFTSSMDTAPPLSFFCRHCPGCQTLSNTIATAIGANSNPAKKSSCANRYDLTPCPTSANRKHVLKYTNIVAITKAIINTFFSLTHNIFDDLTKKIESNVTKIRNPRTCTANPASRIFLCSEGSNYLLIELPINASPTICTIVVTASLVMKMPNTHFGGKGLY